MIVEKALFDQINLLIPGDSIWPLSRLLLTLPSGPGGKKAKTSGPRSGSVGNKAADLRPPLTFRKSPTPETAH